MQKLKLVSLIASILGISLLFVINILTHAKEISSQTNDYYLENNQKVKISGQVIKETINKNSYSLTLQTPNSSFYLYFKTNKNISLLNKNISAIGMLNVYENKTRIKVLEIEVDDN